MASSSPTETATTYTIPNVKLSTVLSKTSSESFTLAAEDIESVYVGVSIGSETKLYYNGKSITGTKSGSIAIAKTHQSQSVTLSLRFNYVGYIERYYGDWGFSDLYSNTGLAVYGSYTITVPAKTHYTVTYNANSGSGAPSAQTKWYGETLTLSSTKPTRSGYVFWHWNTKADNTGTTYAAGANYPANAAATLYAIWNPIISYNANGGTGAPASQTKTYGHDLTLSSTKPTRTNLTFAGWGTSSTATTVAYAAGAKYTSNSAATLYAIWKYTVNFNGNGNGVNPTAQTAVYGHNVTIAGYPTRSGYRFIGWNSVQDGTGTHYAPGASVTVNENCTLYAQWRKVTVSSVKVTRNVRAIGFTSTWSCSSTVGGTVTVTAQYSLDDGESWHDCTLTGDATKPKVAGTDLSGTVSWESTADEDVAVRVMVTASFTDTYSSTSISGGHVETAQRGGTIPKEFRLFDALHGGTGLAIGAIATLANTFEVALQTVFQNIVEVVQSNITRDGTYTEPANGDHQIRFVDGSRRILSYVGAHKTANSPNNYLRLSVYGPSGSKQGNVYISASDTDGYISTDCLINSNLMMSTVNRGYYLKGGDGASYPGIYNNGSNLWIGSTATASTHHVGETYISAGHNGTSGNATIYVSVPNAANNGGTNYGVYHTGNKPTPADIGAQVAGNYATYMSGMNATFGNVTQSTQAWAVGAKCINTTNTTMNNHFSSLIVSNAYVGLWDSTSSTSRWIAYTTSNKPSASDVGALPIGGGTLTGSLTLSEGGVTTTTAAHIIKDTRFNRDGANPSADVWSAVFGFQDKDGEHLGYLQAYQLTNGTSGIQLKAAAENSSGSEVQNYIRIAVDKSGNKAYSVGDAAAFRSAIGAQVAGSYQPAGSYATTNASGKIQYDSFARADRCFYVQGTVNNSTSVVNGKAVSLYVKTTGLNYYDAGATNGWNVYGTRWLYANASGSNGTIELNETAANFIMMEIFFKGNDGTYDSASVYSPNGKVVSLSMQESTANGGNNKKWRSVTISGKSITTKYYSEQDNAGTPTAANHIYICYVLGYYAQK